MIYNKKSLFINSWSGKSILINGEGVRTYFWTIFILLIQDYVCNPIPYFCLFAIRTIFASPFMSVYFDFANVNIFIIINVTGTPMIAANAYAKMLGADGNIRV